MARWMSRGLTAASILALGGCASLGGNIKGSFSCAAPDGVCAPSSVIDDQALAMISGDGAVPGDPGIQPSGSTSSRATALGRRLPVQQTDASRTQERVLRIVFQPYIDERGRLHEASAVHAVVQNSDWQQRMVAGATILPSGDLAGVAAADTLADAVDRNERALLATTVIDPNLPDPAVVEAARARAADPVGAIRADVAARLAPKAGRTPGAVVMPPKSQAPASAGRSAPSVALPAAPASTASKPIAPIAAPQAANGLASPTAATSSGAQAQQRVKADPRIRAAGNAIEATARSAAGTVATPSAEMTKATVRAAAFPGSVPEEQ